MELVKTRRRQLTRQGDDVAVSAVRIRSLVTISVIIIAFAAARETTAVIVADASRVVLTVVFSTTFFSKLFLSARTPRR